ncbi:quinolinate synthase NadA, partial [Azospirillum argentinense]|uniref:quinolinate synthase NadA n=1 Tax=Azospirillum argentinense TaxID=2970906 RepID=UPI001FFF974D
TVDVGNGNAPQACPPVVEGGAVWLGSTARMVDFVADRRPPRVLMVTECSMSDNVAAASPETEFVRPCNLCPHMKKITLANILDSLRTLELQVTIAPEVADRARRSVERMLAVKPR